MTVYVRWYGKILEGELLDGDYLGMKQVRIPLDGHHPIALFTPGHVYETIEAVPTCYPVKDPSVAISDMIKGHYEISQKESVAEFIEHTIDMQRVENFKRDNWDQEHNHLRIDKLDEFYQLWRMAMRPFGFVDEAEAPKEQKTKKKCENCSCFVFTTTLGSPEKPEWHCKHGFLPSNDCQEQAAYNDECMMKDPEQRSAGWKPDPITKGYSEITSPYPAITQPYSGKSQEPTKKMLRSTGVQQFKDSTQLALFE